jgi:hypothetical protein
MADNLQLDRFVTVDLVGWRDRRGRFARAEDEVRDEQRQFAEDVGGRLVKDLSKASPRGKMHKAGTPRFAESWRKRVVLTAAGAQLVVDNTDPKAVLVLGPTRKHAIVARRAKVLRFETAGGSVVYRRRVMHPGTKGSDVVGRVMASAGGPIRDELQKSAVRVAQRIQDIWR